MILFYVILGIAMIGFGIYLTITKIKIIAKGEKDIYAYNLKSLIYGMFFTVIGILVVIKYIPYLTHV